MVPKNAQKIEIEYETNWWTDKKSLFQNKINPVLKLTHPVKSHTCIGD